MPLDVAQTHGTVSVWCEMRKVVPLNSWPEPPDSRLVFGHPLRSTSTADSYPMNHCKSQDIWDLARNGFLHFRMPGLMGFLRSKYRFCSQPARMLGPI